MADAAPLGQQLERLETKLQQLEAAASRNKMTARLMTVLIAITAIVLVLLLLQPFYAIKQNPKPYQDAFSKAMEQRIMPKLQDEGRLLMNEVLPAYQEAIAKAQEERLPEVVQLLESEFGLLLENVTTGVDERISDFRTKYEKEQLEKITTRIPEITDLDRLDRLYKAMDNVSQRLVDELFTDYYVSLDNLERNFNAIEVPEEVSSMTPDELQEHVSVLIVELVEQRLNELRVEAGMDPVEGDILQILLSTLGVDLQQTESGLSIQGNIEGVNIDVNIGTN